MIARQFSTRVRAAFTAGLLLCWLLTATSPLLAQSAGPHAGLIIVIAGDEVLTRCLSLENEQLTGAELLRRADIPVLFSGGSGSQAVCSLQEVGCPASDCFCECKGTPCRYWVYYHRAADGSWAYSAVGASGWTLRAGDVDAWVWGDSSLAPPALTFAEICPAAQPPPAATLPPEVVATPLSTPTAPQSTPYQLFVPASGSQRPAAPPSSATWLARGQRFLDGYGSFALLLLALLAWAWLKRKNAKSSGR
ncbi:MAG: hypothetical protein U9Q70_10565 [Chloroflexota bacterium]|nr:hypothetical protein [Chloroflexota bacterium]